MAGSGTGGRQSRKADAILGIGDKLHAFALVPFGYPAESRDQQDRYDESRVHVCS
ncbi:MAG: hypothetical protein IJV50_08745 [Lachnospiraceae bacterium]|nr:hypothetical protein [Lachnospiraceae bacterium]